jgi:hypothetical protein
MRVLIILFGALLAFAPCHCKVDESTGMIRILSIGEAFYPETRLPFMLTADPRIRYQPVPTNWYEGTFQAVGRGREDAEKFIRLYLPRTYDRYLASYDVTLLSDFDVDIISPGEFAWMERGVREGSMGIAKYEMNYDPAHWHTFDLFLTLEVYKAFPTGLARGVEFYGDGIYVTLMPETGRPHPILDLPNMINHKVPIDIGTGKAGYENPRPGSRIIARYVPNDEPAIIIWDYGSGRALTSVSGHDTIDWRLSEHWPYTIDFWINQAWYLAGLEIPLEIEQIHNLRESSLLYASQRSLATTVIDFVERYGTPTRSLYQRLSETDALKKEADRLYLQDRFEESLEKMEEAFEGLGEVAEESMKAKDAALFWIYVVEWIAVTATAAVAGFTIWTLMIRRRLYREVGLTKTR